MDSSTINIHAALLLLGPMLLFGLSEYMMGLLALGRSKADGLCVWPTKMTRTAFEAGFVYQLTPDHLNQGRVPELS
jgi:hypothetical protein